jgi:hypothetical protein
LFTSKKHCVCGSKSSSSLSYGVSAWVCLGPAGGGAEGKKKEERQVYTRQFGRWLFSVYVCLLCLFIRVIGSMRVLAPLMWTCLHEWKEGRLTASASTHTELITSLLPPSSRVQTASHTPPPTAKPTHTRHTHGADPTHTPTPRRTRTLAHAHTEHISGGCTRTRASVLGYRPIG